MNCREGLFKVIEYDNSDGTYLVRNLSFESECKARGIAVVGFRKALQFHLLEQTATSVEIWVKCTSSLQVDETYGGVLNGSTDWNIPTLEVD